MTNILQLSSWLRTSVAAVVAIGCAFASVQVFAQQTTAVPTATAATTPPAVATTVANPNATPASATATKKPEGTAANPYGLEALWSGSDWIARFVLILLSIMSIGSWYIIILKVMEQSRMHRQLATVGSKFWDAGSVSAGATALEENSPYRYIAQAGVDAIGDHAGLKKNIPIADWLQMNVQGAVDRVQARTQSGLAFLATVGSTSPFVGLFGTVWGIYHALTAIGISGQASIDKVAGPVGEALIMTAIGLAVAIPAVLGYNWLAKRNKAVMDEVREFSEEVNAVLVGSAGKAA